MGEINKDDTGIVNSETITETMEAQKNRKKKLCKKGIQVGLLCGALGLAVWGGMMFQKKSSMEKEAFAEKSEEKPAELFAMQSPDGTWGYINRAGEVMIYPQYDTAENFSESGLALVQKDGEWGYIDKTGTFIIGPSSSAEFYTANKIKTIYANPTATWNKEVSLLPFEVYGKWGFVTQKGEVVIPFLYEEVHPFSQERALVYDGNYYGFIDKLGTEVIPLSYEYAFDFNSAGLAIAEKEGYYGMIDNLGNEVLPFRYSDIDGVDDSGLLAVQDSENYLWGYVNEKGIEVIPCIYDQANMFYESEYAEIIKEGITGLIDKQGKEIFLEEDVYIVEYYYPYIVVSNYDNQQSIIDVRKEITNLQWYDYIYVYDEEKGIVEVNKDGKSGLISLKSDWKTKVTYDYIYVYDEENEIAIFEKNGGYGALKIFGEEIIPPIYENLYFYDDYYYATKNGKAGVLTEEQKIVVPFEYDMVLPLRQLNEKLENIVLVGEKNKFGFMNSSFEIIEELQEVDSDQKNYQEIQSKYEYEITSMEEYMLENGYQYAKEFLLYIFKYLKSVDEELIGRIFNVDWNYDDSGNFDIPNEEGYYIMEKDYLYGLEDSQNNVVVEPVYDEIYPLNEEVYLVTKDEKYGLMDLKGNMLIEPDCTSIGDLNEWGLYSVLRSTGFAYYNQSGECVLSFLEPGN